MTTRHSETAAKKCRGSSVLPDPRCCWDEPFCTKNLPPQIQQTPQTRTVGGTFDLTFTLPEPANAGGGPKKDRKTSNATKKKLTQAKTKKATKPPQHTPRPQRVPTRDPSQEAG